MTKLLHHRGFTLVEMVMVIIIIGVIGRAISAFMKSPVDAYFASAQRAALTDTADTTVRRIARDIQRSLPNSIRTSGAQCLEFIPTKTGARYRADDTAGGLSFTTAGESNFNMLGSNTDFAGVPNALPANQRIASGDVIVVYNLGITGANAYNNDNTAVVNGAPVVAVAAPAETGITVTPNVPTSPTFPLPSGTSRFQVVPAAEWQVAYVCNGTNLIRTASTAFTVAPACPTSGSVIATNVNCASTTFNYTGSNLQRNALVSMVLTVTDPSSGETVSLQHEVHVSNTP